MTKAELRKKYKKLRRELSFEQIDAFSIEIANRLLELPIWEYSFYHLFLSITEHKEVNTDYLLNILSGKDKHIVISRCNFKDISMVHFLLTDNTTIKKSDWGIPEPIDGIEIGDKKIDVIFVPLLTFDKQGNRVGYGKGYYDRFLNACKPETIKIGLSFFEAEKELIQVNEHDVTLDYCVTPNQVYQF